MGINDPTPGGVDPSVATTVVVPAPALTQPAPVRWAIHGQTHVGKVRRNNEDQYLILRGCKSLDVLDTSLPPDPRWHLMQQEIYYLLVADGMGGHAAGELASALVVEQAIRHVLETAKWFFRLDDPDENVRLRLLRESLERADRNLIEAGQNDPALAGMGTTLTAVSILGADVFVVHVGDSRVYLFCDGKLEQLTRDHTLAQEMADRGLLAAEEVRTHRLRHVLTNVLGCKAGVRGEIVKLRLADGDRLLLCTDGLTEMVPDGQIAELLVQCPDPREACGALVDRALSQGGTDNVTVIVAGCSMPAGS
jgi:protein phosphatase